MCQCPAVATNCISTSLPFPNLPASLSVSVDWSWRLFSTGSDAGLQVNRLQQILHTSHHQERHRSMKKILMLLGCLFACHQALALPSFDPFADATANGGTTYSAGDALTNQFNPSLFSAWFPRGASLPGTQPLIAAG